jgi:Spy/CpxP family protein refolding chaperone
LPRLAIGALATAAAGSAGAFGRRGGPPDLGRLEQRIERLDVSADVRAKAFAILDAQRAKDRALREQVRAAHEELRAMLESGTPETAKLDRQVDALGALRTPAAQAVPAHDAADRSAPARGPARAVDGPAAPARTRRTPRAGEHGEQRPH